jgi:LRP1 type putative zinc finger protein
MKCRDCGNSGAKDSTWGLCKSCYKAQKGFVKWIKIVEQSAKK